MIRHRSCLAGSDFTSRCSPLDHSLPSLPLPKQSSSRLSLPRAHTRRLSRIHPRSFSFDHPLPSPPSPSSPSLTLLQLAASLHRPLSLFRLLLPPPLLNDAVHLGQEAFGDDYRGSIQGRETDWEGRVRYSRACRGQGRREARR